MSGTTREQLGAFVVPSELVARAFRPLRNWCDDPVLTLKHHTHVVDEHIFARVFSARKPTVYGGLGHTEDTFAGLRATGLPCPWIVVSVHIAHTI